MVNPNICSAEMDCPEELRFNVDHLLVRDNDVYGWGWLFHTQRAVAELYFVARINGKQHRFACRYGMSRPDVSRLHSCASALGSGFTIFCRLPRGHLSEWLLQVHLADGSTCTVNIGPYVVIGSSGAAESGWLISRWVRTACSHLLRGDLKGLFQRARDKMLARLSARREIEPGCSMEKSEVARFLRRSISAGESKFALVIDHNLGGGAGHYRERWIREQRESGNGVLLVYRDLPSLRYCIRCFNKNGEDLCSFESLQSLEVLGDMADNPRLEEMLFNNVVSFRDPLNIAALLPTLKYHTGARLVIAIHDYFTVCPSFALIDDSGKFCGIPDTARCRKCLPHNHGEHRFFISFEDIDLWRREWGSCLNHADAIRCFSHSSVRLLQRAYPGLDSEKFEVHPHPVDYLPARPVLLNHEGPLNIGIVGAITSMHKGADIVGEMVRVIEERHIQATITVIGELARAPKSPALKVTGPYKREDLPELIEKSGANVFFLPSICPETFSYVTEELVRLNVPLATFDVGAPAERVATYANGMVITGVNAEDALEQLMALHRRYSKVDERSG